MAKKVSFVCTGKTGDTCKLSKDDSPGGKYDFIFAINSQGNQKCAIGLFDYENEYKRAKYRTAKQNEQGNLYIDEEYIYDRKYIDKLNEKPKLHFDFVCCKCAEDISTEVIHFSKLTS